MKFRDIDVDKVKVITTEDAKEMERAIEKASKGYVIVDLQYGTSTSGTSYVYSVLLLLRKA